jgi:hypothetical protein
MKSKYIICNVLLASVVLAGCAPGVSSYINEDVDFSYIQRVAVYPFENFSSDNQAGPKVESVFLAELLEVEGIRVVSPGETRGIVYDLRLPLTADLQADEIIALGKALGVEAVFFGKIEEYGVRADSRDRANAVTASFSLVETVTGTMIWRAQVSEDGGSVWRKIFGGGTASMYDVTRGIVRDALGTLF